MASPDMTDKGNNPVVIPDCVQDSTDKGDNPVVIPDSVQDSTDKGDNPVVIPDSVQDSSLICLPCHLDTMTRPAVGYCTDCEVSDKMINSPDYNNTIDRIDKLLNKCTSIKAETSRDTNKSNDSLTNALLEITKYRHEMNKRLDELQNKLESEIQVLQQLNDDSNHAADTVCEEVMKEVKMMHESITQLNTSKQANQLFIEIKQAQKQLREYEKSISSVVKGEDIVEYEFVPNQAISEVLQNEEGIGSISTKHSGHNESSHSSNPSVTSTYTNITPTNQHEICVKTEEDRQRCWITGMTMLQPDRLVLVDYNNNSIKLVDVDSKTVTAQLSLGSEYVDTPCDITSMTSTQVAVTVPDRQHIQFVSVSVDKLSKTHTIQTNGNCSHIGSVQNKLIVTYSNPEKMEILDMNGKLLTRVKTDASGKDVFNQPTYVQANSGSIYVCDVEYRMVLRLSWTGEITGRFGDLGDPAGLALLGDQSVLVCDYSSNKIHQVSGDCTSGRSVLQDLRCPLAVCVDGEGRKLYISRYTRHYGYIDNSILGYNL